MFKVNFILSSVTTKLLYFIDESLNFFLSGTTLDCNLFFSKDVLLTSNNK